MDITTADPKGLIRESYRMEGITLAECKSIFLDWALSLPPKADIPTVLNHLLATYDTGEADHPMTQVLKAAQHPPPAAQRRGGRSARLGYAREKG